MALYIEKHLYVENISFLTNYIQRKKVIILKKKLMSILKIVIK